MRTAALLFTGYLTALSAMAAEVPRPAPELTMQGSGGKPIKLSQFRGKVVLLTMMHTTCQHCQDLTRLLVPIQKDYQARNVVVVECAFNEDAPMTMGPFYKVFEPNFPVGVTNEAAVREFLKWNDKKDGVLMVPHVTFIDAKGTIVADHGENDFFGPAMDKNIRGVLDRLVSKAPAAAAKKK
jgi:thiol-disulfide isomerase/thioredoxin